MNGYFEDVLPEGGSVLEDLDEDLDEDVLGVCPEACEKIVELYEAPVEEECESLDIEAIEEQKAFAGGKRTLQMMQDDIVVLKAQIAQIQEAVWGKEKKRQRRS
jgi:hypothetical protein